MYGSSWSQSGSGGGGGGGGGSSPPASGSRTMSASGSSSPALPPSSAQAARSRVESARIFVESVMPGKTAGRGGFQKFDIMSTSRGFDEAQACSREGPARDLARDVVRRARRLRRWWQHRGAAD